MNIQAVRGMNDILPEETPYWRQVEGALREVAMAYGYQEIRMPLLESTDLFKRSIGEVTDIVEKEMYTFADRNGDSLTLRPEGTAGCVRAGVQNGLLHNQTQRLWYTGPMFRHERPQKGRYRQFHQFGVEAFGMDGPDVDAELILMTARIWRRLGLLDGLTLQLNSLGSPQARQAYRTRLVDYFTRHHAHLDEESRRRLDTNPLRILDSKNPDLRPLIEQAPKITEHLDEASHAHFDGLTALLNRAGVRYQINPCLVRGLDYYTKTVFEWVTDRLGAQGTVCAGGRFDGLVEQLGGKPTPAAGWAAGLERLVELVKAGQPAADAQCHVYLVMLGGAAQQAGLGLAETLRDAVPGLRLLANCGEAGLKAQMKRADRSGAAVALLLGEDEMASQSCTLKYLRVERPQQSLPQDQLADVLKTLVAG